MPNIVVPMSWADAVTWEGLGILVGILAFLFFLIAIGIALMIAAAIATFVFLILAIRALARRQAGQAVYYLILTVFCLPTSFLVYAVGNDYRVTKAFEKSLVMRVPLYVRTGTKDNLGFEQTGSNGFLFKTADGKLIRANSETEAANGRGAILTKSEADRAYEESISEQAWVMIHSIHDSLEPSWNPSLVTSCRFNVQGNVLKINMAQGWNKLNRRLKFWVVSQLNVGFLSPAVLNSQNYQILVYNSRGRLVAWVKPEASQDWLNKGKIAPRIGVDGHVYILEGIMYRDVRTGENL